MRGRALAVPAILLMAAGGCLYAAHRLETTAAVAAPRSVVAPLAPVLSFRRLPAFLTATVAQTRLTAQLDDIVTDPVYGPAASTWAVVHGAGPASHAPTPRLPMQP